MGRMLSIWRVLRVHQWPKNGFVLAGYLFSNGWHQPGLSRQALLLMASFCLISSAVYVLNDLVDRQRDRLHPVKRHRPIASGDLPIAGALFLLAGLSATGLWLSWKASSLAFGFASGYFALNLLYSLALQNVVIVDVFSIAAGFMIRVLVGTAGIGIPPSNWLLLCAMMLSLFLGFGKRYAELIAGAGAGGRRVLQHYTPELLQGCILVSAAGAMTTYALYTVDPTTTQIHGTTDLVHTVPVVVYGLFRYLFSLFGRGAGQNPSHDIFADPHLIGSGLVWIGLVIYLLW